MAAASAAVADTVEQTFCELVLTNGLQQIWRPFLIAQMISSAFPRA